MNFLMKHKSLGYKTFFRLCAVARQKMKTMKDGFSQTQSEIWLNVTM